MVAGEYHAIGYNLQGMGEKQLAKTKETLENAQRVIATNDDNQLDTLTRHDTIGAMLQGTVQSYFATNQIQNRLLASKTNVVQSSQLSFGTVSTDLTTDYYIGLPVRTRSTGIVVDMDRLYHQVVSKDNKAEEQAKFLSLQGIQESANENLVPEKLFEDSEGISAVRALQIATQEGQAIYTITQDNQAQVVPKLSAHSAQTLADVNNALNAGLQVTIEPPQVYRRQNN